MQHVIQDGCLVNIAADAFEDERKPCLHVIWQLPQHCLLIAQLAVPILVLEVLNDTTPQRLWQVMCVCCLLQYQQRSCVPGATFNVMVLHIGDMLPLYFPEQCLQGRWPNFVYVLSLKQT